MKQILRSILLLLICLGAVPTSAQDRPNFVWLISEDNSKHFLKLFDETGAETPNIAKLAQNGLIFNHAFSNAPVCSVARTTLITSCYAPRIGTQYHRRSKMVPMPEGLKMFPAYLKEAGYYTTNRRKTDYNAIAGEKGAVWNESSNKASWRNRKPNQSFFHKQSFSTTHEGSLHFSKKVMANEKTTTDPKTVFVPPRHPDTKTFRYTYARYHDRIKQVDQLIGEVVNQLEKDGLLEETFIFYFGDHGGVVPGTKGYAYETGLHIPLVVRVPENWKHLVDAQNGSTVSGFVSFVDFGPTLLNLAGVKIPDQIDGQPFLGNSASIEEVNQRDSVFGYADRFDEKYDHVRTLRVGNWKYIRNYQSFNFDGLQNNYRYRMLAYTEWRDLFHAGRLDANQKQFFEPRPPEELYDLENDPYELNNLADQPDQTKRLRELRNRLSSHVKDTCDLSMYPESYLYQHAFDNPVEFGKKRKDEISQLVDIADLQLADEAAVEPLLDAAKSPNPWIRYWGLIGMSSFAKKEKSWINAATNIAQNDPVNMNRVRAAEYLGLIREENAASYLLEALVAAESGTEANLILNSITLLKDGPQKLNFELERKHFDFDDKDAQNVKRREEYLLGKPNRK